METSGISHFLYWLGRTSLEAGIMVLLVLVANWLFQRQLTPRWRCALWLLVATRLLLPFSPSSAISVFNLLPRTSHLEFAGPVQMTTVVSARADRPMPFAPSAQENKPNTGRRTAGGDRPLAAMAPKAAKSGFAWSWPIFIFSIWLAGVLVLTKHVLASSLRLWRHSTPLQPALQTLVTPLLRECCERLQIQNPPVVFESAGTGSPALHGVLHPRLLLPKGFAEKFSRAEMRFVFLHELAHLKRHDLLMNWLVVALQVLHWFNPLVWFGFSRWRAERELACDAMALEAAGEGQNKEYGRTILRLLDSFGRPTATPGLVGILEDKRQLRRRIGMIANFAPARGWPRLAVILIGVLVAIGLTDAQSGSSPAGRSPAISTAMLSTNQLENTTTTPQQKGSDMSNSSITNQLARSLAAGLLAFAAPATSTVAHAADNPASATVQETADDLTGAWIMVGTPGHVGKVPSAGGRIKLFTGKYWCITQAEPKSGVVLFHHGGTYTINGNSLHANLDFANSSTMNMIGKTNGNFTLKIEGDTLTSLGMDNPWQEVWKRLQPRKSISSPLAKSLTGTWAYAGKPGETNLIPNMTRLKFCAGGYWCDTEMDSKTGVVVIHHGGYYSLKGNKYVETCQYANPTTMNLIGQDAKFDVTIEGDTLTLKGIDNPWNEVWKRLD